MNRNKLKAYAPKARREFIKAVTDRAAFYGLTKDKIEPITERGDVAIIGGKPFPIDVAKKRKRLEERIRREGFGQVMEAMAYTWFNRFVAIRYMEVHGYLEHGYRVLSATPVEYPGRGPGSTGRANSTNDTNKGGTVSGFPEILVYAEHVDLPGLDREKVVELKLAGNRDKELYRMLLIAQCNALHKAMPFLFERIGGYTELLMPDNLLHSNSPVRKLVNEIPEEDWQEIEIIGWLYQFYISERKDEVIGKVVKSEDIPAATQLFTPNWIVKYMVQNSLGAQWLATYPNSPLKSQMEYYIEPAEQTEEVKAQLTAITPSTLNPEELTLIDPADGSGHILVEGYELFKAIYLECGYRLRDVPQLILEKNLFGLDIDERAAQLTGFALMMKGRADDRRLFERGVKLNVMALVDSAGFDAEGLAKGVELSDYGLKPGDLTELKQLFEHATTFGSLIRVPEGLAEKLQSLKQLSEASSQDLFVSDALNRLGPLVQQAELLAAQYDAVVANPPYMGSKFHVPVLKQFLKDNYDGYEKDFFSAFIFRSLNASKRSGQIGIVAPYVWMFLSSYQSFREQIVDETSLSSLIQLEYNAFEPACIPVATFTIIRRHVPGYTGSYIKLSAFTGHRNQAPRTLEAIKNPDCGWFHRAQPDEFKRIPGSPIAYWAGESVLNAFGDSINRHSDIEFGVKTGDNDRFLRLWHEVDISETSLRRGQHAKWQLHNKGGKLRRWSGNIEHVIRWDKPSLLMNVSKDIKPDHFDSYTKPAVTWSEITSSDLSTRLLPSSVISNNKGPCAVFDDQETARVVLSATNSTAYNELVKIINPTLSLPVGDFGKLPYITLAPEERGRVTTQVDRLLELSRLDLSMYEDNWEFHAHPLLKPAWTSSGTGLASAYTALVECQRNATKEAGKLEHSLDEFWCSTKLSFGVEKEERTPTLRINPAYRYGGKLSEGEQWTRFRQDSTEELVSYAIGCMMGRYSLDQPGLIYAHSGNDQFWEIYHEKHNRPVPPQNKDHSSNSRYSWSTFSPDQDGIIPITDTDWFPDDAANRFIEFISVAWPKEHLEENLKFVADSLGPKRGESCRETIRRYISTGFFKHHMKMYKKRPIYWLFSSGKLRAFQCLVYLHRYNEGTLSRMRTEYVIPLQGKIAARIEQLSGDISAATSTAHRKKLERERDKLVKQQTELQAFDEKLRHYADQRISLDLDDGVKVNYGKFGDLLAEVKAITGKKKK